MILLVGKISNQGPRINVGHVQTAPTKGSVIKREMYTAYQKWSEANGIEAVNISVFGRHMKAHRIEEWKSGSKRFWKNVSLKKVTYETEHFDQELEEQAV